MLLAIPFLASPNILNQDVTVMIDLDPQGIQKLTAIKQAGGDSTVYSLPPAGTFSFTNSITIKKGKRIDSSIITVNTSTFDLSQAYVIPPIITGVSPSSIIISGNFGKLFLIVAPKNDYDGIYSVSGYILRDKGLTLGRPIKPGVKT